MAKIEENIINNSTPGEFKKRGIDALIVLVTNQAMLSYYYFYFGGSR